MSVLEHQVAQLATNTRGGSAIGLMKVEISPVQPALNSAIRTLSGRGNERRGGWLTSTQTQSTASGPTSYTLPQLLSWAKITRGSLPQGFLPSEEVPAWATVLRQDLLTFFQENLYSQSRERLGIPYQNLAAIADRLYQTPLSTIAPRYHTRRKIKRVVDLYFLTEAEFTRFGRNAKKSCGPKTLQCLRDLLQAYSLPPLAAITQNSRM
jgi:hypothetical protein